MQHLPGAGVCVEALWPCGCTEAPSCLCPGVTWSLAVCHLDDEAVSLFVTSAGHSSAKASDASYTCGVAATCNDDGLDLPYIQALIWT